MTYILSPESRLAIILSVACRNAKHHWLARLRGLGCFSSRCGLGVETLSTCELQHGSWPAAT